MKTELTIGDFLTELRRQIENRKLTDRNFSLLKMAKELEVHESTLRKILGGQRALGIRVAREMAQKFGYTILAPEKKRRQKTPKTIKALNASVPSQLGWAGLALLELIKLDAFEPDESWVAQRLGLPLQVVKRLIRDLEVDGILSRSTDGWRDHLEDASIAAAGEFTTQALRKAQTDVLHLSAEKVDAVSIGQRAHAFAVLAMSPDDLSSLKKLLQDFRRNLCEKAQSSRHTKKKIYVLQTGLFPVTQ